MKKMVSKVSRYVLTDELDSNWQKKIVKIMICCILEKTFVEINFKSKNVLFKKSYETEIYVDLI